MDVREKRFAVGCRVVDYCQPLNMSEQTKHDVDELGKLHFQSCDREKCD